MTYFRINKQVNNKFIKNLILLKCPGKDEIFKISVDSISKALRLTFNRLLLHGDIPVDWKIANVVPIFKKDSKGEKIIIDQLV